MVQERFVSLNSFWSVNFQLCPAPGESPVTLVSYRRRPAIGTGT